MASDQKITIPMPTLNNNDGEAQLRLETYGRDGKESARRVARKGNT